ncbi:hypothetical protein ZIOFF_033568 [Zingiber officinale]|uniref:Chlorophyll a-b binding protein, chloroplastic n=1 Tax=Zingiber officinale TaxID=94328 RepID=A0A8J5GJZ8_ZINOF|nr:hypothetical protein ZIOFF_033568 [Zingiber officinale]
MAPSHERCWLRGLIVWQGGWRLRCMPPHHSVPLLCLTAFQLSWNPLAMNNHTRGPSSIAMASTAACPDMMRIESVRARAPFHFLLTEAALIAEKVDTTAKVAVGGEKRASTLPVVRVAGHAVGERSWLISCFFSCSRAAVVAAACWVVISAQKCRPIDSAFLSIAPTNHGLRGLHHRGRRSPCRSCSSDLHHCRHYPQRSLRKQPKGPIFSHTLPRSTTGGQSSRPRPLAGDFGFDPLGLGVEPDSLRWYVQAELVHCRFAMAGVAGILFTDLLRVTGISNIPVWFEAGAVKFDFASTPALFIVQLLLMGFVETKRYMDFIAPGSQTKEGTFLGIEAALQGLQPGYPGGPLFDPLGLAKDIENKSELKLKEIKNGRLAMVAMLGFFVQANVTHAGPIDNLIVHLSDPFKNTIIQTLSLSSS